MRWRQLPKTLRRCVDLSKAKARGLGKVFGQDPDPDDMLDHAVDGWRGWLAHFDKFFAIGPRHKDKWQARCKALVEYEFGIKADDPNWWGRFFISLAVGYLKGFSVQRQRKVRRPLTWSNERSAQLLADVEFLKRKTGMSARNVCERLPKRHGYKERWGNYRGAALRKAYTTARKRRRIDHGFEAELCGRDGLMSSNDGDRLTAAINRHALKR